MAEVAPGEAEDDPDLDPDLEEEFTFGKWTGPKFLFKKVHKWAMKDTDCGEKTIGAFLQYCWGFCESDQEEDEMFEWMLSLVTLYVREDGWKGFREGALLWDWSQFAIKNRWEIPIPEFAKIREEEDIMNGMGKVAIKDEVKKDEVETDEFEKDEVEKVEVEKDDVEKYEKSEDDLKKGEVKKSKLNEDEMVEVFLKGEEVKKAVIKKAEVKEVVIEDEMKRGEVQEFDVKKVVVMMKEALVKKEGMKEGDFDKLVEISGEVASPWSSWGSQLPPASPPVLVPLPTWRPWEQNPKKPKKRSPASEARSLGRLLEWQQRMDLRRASNQSTRECSSSSTPLPPGKELKNVRLLKRLEDVQRGKSGSQAFPSSQWSGSQTSPASPSWFVSQTPAASSPWSGTQITPATPSWSGSQTAPATPSWSGSQTNSTSPPWSGNQGNMHQGNWQPASTSQTQTMLQLPLQPLVPLPSSSPGHLPPQSSSLTRPAG